jgi:hypothetical protein
MRASRLVAAAVTTSALAATVVVPMTAYADTGTASTPAPACAALPSYVEGRPADLHARAAAGDYLWHDSEGWHLRVTHRTTRRMVFRGVISASAPLTYRRVRDESRDRVVASGDGTKLVFRFVNHGGIDGVDFADGCAATLKLVFAVNGHRLGRNHVFVGAHSARPAHNPFVIARQDQQPAT